MDSNLNANNIKKIICKELIGDDQIVANKLVEFLQKHDFEFFRDEGDCWKDKIYYWIRYKNQCVCFISIKDHDEPDNRWTVWSDDICSEYLNDNSITESLKQLALKHVDECSRCGSCGGGKPKVIFGKEFYAVCGCTFRFDNPQINDLPFIEYMIKAKVKQIDKSNL